jgi:hypothetical protein
MTQLKTHGLGIRAENYYMTNRAQGSSQQWHSGNLRAQDLQRPEKDVAVLTLWACEMKTKE